MRLMFILSLIALSSVSFLNANNSQSSEKITKNPPYVKAIYSFPLSYDPIKMNDGASLVFSELVYEGLLRLTEDYDIRPAIAESWSTTADGLIITFKINPEAKFHNGREITAHDVKESLSRNVSRESRVFKFYDVIKGAKDYFNGIKNNVTGLKVIDLRTIEVHLEKPFPPLLYVLAGGTAKILPADLVHDKDFFKNPIGSGPFKLNQIKDREIHLLKFAEYYGQTPHLEEMILTELSQDDAIEKARIGEIHDLSIWPMNGKEAIFKYGQDINSIVADTWIIGLNTRIKPFDSLEVRKLFQQSIDSNKFRVKFYEDAKPAYGYIAPFFPGHQETRVPVHRIDQAPPIELVTVHIPLELSKSDEMAKFLEDQLTVKGWNAKVLAVKWEDMMRGYNQKNLQAFLVAMNVDYPDSEFLLNNFESTNPDNFSGIKDQEIDALILKSRQTQDRIERQTIQTKLAKRVNSLSLTVNLLHSRAHYWIHKCVEGFRPNLLAVAYTDYRNVNFNYKCISNEGKN